LYTHRIHHFQQLIEAMLLNCYCLFIDLKVIYWASVDLLNVSFYSLLSFLVIGEDDIGIYVCNNSHESKEVAVNGVYFLFYCLILTV